ncbi:WbqC family protein [Wenyingzhuangia sp. 2_MG-2023]|uniref:WbqC family protein n=1 Tax=Wenyingzhuangia sp. 2_MG-2023 TaxID=3062639 RepID=UPI0026E2C2C6|nr:WbqC family protein [Wenyingzhuangia sp. 2_MG-2023]MDO6737855.1 WbqC family protein [Wenyingzhuangia sp. 2_MG-2023]
MVKNIVIQPAYFAPIAQYAAIIQANSILFETQDNFEKQTYRNRSYIYAANGKLLLNIPIQSSKGEKLLSTSVKINYAEDWQKLHFKSIQSAYRSSPFFEYYEHDLAPIFDKKYTYLSELHQDCHHFVMDALQENKTCSKTKVYTKEYSQDIDLRNWTNPKQNLQLDFPSYIQVFDDKHGFIPNLSILDLIFMEGPNAGMYLEKLNLNHVNL